MELSRQVDLKKQFDSFFDQKLKGIIEDNRRRYRMKLKDEAERLKRHLSVLPSTKSTAAVDRYVERALQEYHMDPDALSYSARSLGGIDADQGALWLTELFRYRSKNTFPFFTWHECSLTAGAADGLECAFVSWKKEVFRVPGEPQYFAVDAMGAKMPVSVEDYQMGTILYPDSYVQEQPEKVIMARDTWWIDQLMPRRDCWWDPKAPLMDVNLGQYAGVKLPQTAESVQAYIDAGIYDAVPEDFDLEAHQSSSRQDGKAFTVDRTGTVGDTDSVNLGDRNLIEVWCAFWRENGRWMCQYSIEGTTQLSSARPVNDVFFAGRPFSGLPLVIGTHKFKLWEQIGRGTPETIAPLEDEWTDHRNNVNDAAKLQIQGQWRVERGSDVILDHLLNGKIVYGDAGEFERLDKSVGVLDTMRAADSINSDMNELLPASIESSGRGIVPKGTDRTLGATQMAMMSSDVKLGVQLMTRNQTFLVKIMGLIAELEFSFESDSMIARIAGRSAGIDVPMQMQPDGNWIVDFRSLDFAVDVQINAGMGAIPRQQKAAAILQLAELGAKWNVPQDFPGMYGQLSILGGFGKDQFISRQPPPSPKPQWEAKVEIPWSEMPPEAKQAMLAAMAGGDIGGKANVKDDTEKMIREARQNGGGLITMDRATAPVQDATGDAAMRMSEGGMQ